MISGLCSSQRAVAIIAPPSAGPHDGRRPHPLQPADQAASSFFRLVAGAASAAGSGCRRPRDHHLGEADVLGDGVAGADAAGGEQPAVRGRGGRARRRRRRAARRTVGGRAVGEAGDLQRQVVLVGPEPGHRADRLVVPEHVARGQRALLLGAAPALEAHPAVPVERMRERAAVAGGEDRRVGGGERRVDGDAVVEGEPAAGGERGVRARRRCRSTTRSAGTRVPSASATPLGGDARRRGRRRRKRRPRRGGGPASTAAISAGTPRLTAAAAAPRSP